MVTTRAAAFQPGEVARGGQALPTWSAMQTQFREVIESGRLTRGPYLEQFEAMVERHLGVEHALGVSSGSSGLLLTLSLLPKGSEVIVPSFSFFVVGHAVMWNHLRPTFVDCEPDTFTISPRAVEKAITPQTSAILAAHVFGSPADHEKLRAIADRWKLKLFYHAAHAFGATYHGAPVGSLGDASVMSCTLGQLVTTGEGGLAVTRRDDIARHLELGRDYGNPGNSDCEFCGLSARMTEFSAIIGMHTLRHLPDAVKRRATLAARYRDNLSEVPGICFQAVREGAQSSWKTFAILVDDRQFPLTRDELRAHLAEHNIPTQKCFDPPIHRQRAYRLFADFYDQELPVTEELAERIICLPTYPDMSVKTVDSICEVIQAAGRN